MNVWQAGGYAPMDGTPILVLDSDGSGAQTVSYREVDGRAGWYDLDNGYIADNSHADASIFAAGWMRLPPMQEQFARQHIEEAN